MSKRHPKVSYWQDAPLPRDQLVLFAESLEARIPEDHPVRVLDEILDRLDWSDWESEYHGAFGQPPIHPSVLCKVLLFALIRRIRSSRQIEYNLRHSIDFIWLASGRTIDHVTLSNFRRDHPKRLKGIYQQLVKTAIDLGVAKLSELCIDGSRVLANANRHKNWTQARVAKVLAELDQEIQKAFGEMDLSDAADDLLDDGQPANKLPASIASLKERREQLDQVMANLKEMDAVRQAKGTDPQKNPAQIPKTDTDARVLPNKEGGYAANFTPMAVTETENGFIVGADVVIGNVEHAMMLPMVDEIIEVYGALVDTMMGDSAYSTGANLQGCQERTVELLSPLPEPSQDENPAIRDDLSQPVAADKVDQLPIKPQTKRFDKSAFVYDEEEDCYHCPAGKKLPRRGTEMKNRNGQRVLQIHYVCDDCRGCSLASKCRTNPESKQGRKVSHDEFEPSRRRHRERMKSKKATERYPLRQHFGETQFAVIKEAMSLRRFLLRGIQGVQTEWLWGCTAFNMKKLVNLLGAMRADKTEKTSAASA